ncbi:DUF4369 domain-containing protein [Aurantibacter aestuarii]|uniref:DUF4369 domain-containing protein n=1 Tax=Aurantibacter aestuarii TaxID=1266046 RepID=A0A2T1N9G5_9FLAO|nr:DUF4369 domain-containing protein [Aurantibacter aestuarii]PSG88511.1 hypothetical protein C7H52_09430 [Aurantibacter aestuarii]
MKNVILLFLLSICISGCKEKENDGYTIKIVNIKKENFNKMLYLIKIEERKKVIIDSVIIDSETEMFEGVIKHPDLRHLKFKNGNRAYSFTLTNESIQIILDNYDISQSAITGSSVYSLSNIYNHEIKSINEALVSINKKATVLDETIDKAEFNKAKLVADSLLREKINTDIAFIKKHPSNVFVTTLLGNLIFNYEISLEEGRNLYQLLQGDAKSSQAAIQIKTFLN